MIFHRDTVSGNVNDTVNDTVKRILIEMKDNPNITYAKLGEKIGKSRRTIIRHVEKLKQEGIVKRIGSDKTGSWKVSQ